MEPDKREFLYFDVNNILMLEPDAIPHYWTILLSKFQLLDDKRPRAICLDCNNSNVFEFKKKLYCGDDFKPVIKNNKIIDIKKINELRKDHKVTIETANESIKRLINKILEILEEPTDYKMDLFDLESYMFMQEEDGYFETKLYGDITKNQIKKMLYQVKKVLLDRLENISQNIKFLSQIRTPPIKM